jgi:hypothetical protein
MPFEEDKEWTDDEINGMFQFMLDDFYHITNEVAGSGVMFTRLVGKQFPIEYISTDKHTCKINLN